MKLRLALVLLLVSAAGCAPNEDMYVYSRGEHLFTVTGWANNPDVCQDLLEALRESPHFAAGFHFRCEKSR